MATWQNTPTSTRASWVVGALVVLAIILFFALRNNDGYRETNTSGYTGAPATSVQGTDDASGAAGTTGTPRPAETVPGTTDTRPTDDSGIPRENSGDMPQENSTGTGQ